MMCVQSYVYCVVLLLNCCGVQSIFLVIPEDVPMGFAAIFGFSPKLLAGNDHRFGFGFRLGNHADFQVLYEFGPQTHTEPLEPLRGRSVAYSERTGVSRRRPILDFLLRTGFLKQSSYRYDVNHDHCLDEPR